MERDFRCILDILAPTLRLLILVSLLFQQGAACSVSHVSSSPFLWARVPRTLRSSELFRSPSCRRVCWGSSVPAVAACEDRRQFHKPPRVTACEVRDAWLWTEEAVLGHQVLGDFVLDFGRCHPRREVPACSACCHRMDQKMLGQIVFNLIEFLVSSYIR